MRCTMGEARTVSRDGREPLLEAMRRKLRSEEGKRIYEKRGYRVEPVFRQIKWDSRKLSMDLRGSMKVRGEFSLMYLVHNVKKIVKRVLDGTVSLPRKYNKLIEEAVLGYREEQLIWSGLRYKISPENEQK
jgi:outer membrane lipopolysaccharide assembly protein LptE/RlpB